MSIQEHALDIQRYVDRCIHYACDQDDLDAIHEHAQAILDALKWIPMSERMPPCDKIIRARILSEDGWVEVDADYRKDVLPASLKNIEWRELI